MKVLLFFSGQSSLSHIFRQIFNQKSNDVELINYLDFLPERYHSLIQKSAKLPRIIESKIRRYYLKQIQLKYIEIINRKKPDVLFIYNDQMLCAETLDKVSRNIKVGIYLADSPLFLQKRAHIIGLIRRADVVYAPDTYWLQQCRLLGVKKTEYLIPGFNLEHHFPLVPSAEQLSKYESEVFFMGSPYNDSWGYKRALFLSKFCDFNFRFLGPESWKDWFALFPELEKKFILKTGYLSDSELNVMMNCSKIVPVDANPGIINGFHVRVFDCIASGVLPIIEYRSDLDSVFENSGLQFVKNYNELPELSAFYISNDKERLEQIGILQKTILKKFNLIESTNLIFSTLFS